MNKWRLRRLRQRDRLEEDSEARAEGVLKAFQSEKKAACGGSRYSFRGVSSHPGRALVQVAQPFMRTFRSVRALTLDAGVMSPASNH